jgi:uncharacterized membrane protein (DUF485 family)
VLHVKLLHPRNMFCTFTVAFSAVCVQRPIWLFFLIPCFVLSWYVVQVCLSDFAMVLGTPIIIGITFAFTFQMS